MSAQPLNPLLSKPLRSVAAPSRSLYCMRETDPKCVQVPQGPLPGHLQMKRPEDEPLYQKALSVSVPELNALPIIVGHVAHIRDYPLLATFSCLNNVRFGHGWRFRTS